MFEYARIGIERNRAIDAADLARCRAVIASLSGAQDGPDRFGAERNWISPAGQVAHGDVGVGHLTTFDDAFVGTLRHHCHVFTGYHLTDLLTGRHTPSWTDLVRVPDAELWPDWSIPMHLAMRALVPPDLIWDPPLVAGEVGFDVDGRCVNRDVVGYQERINLLHEGGVLDRLRGLDRPRVLEIGGGYGALALILTRLIPRADYTIVDLPSSLMFSGCYLSVAQHSHVVAPVEPTSAAPAIRLVPNHAAADRLRGERFDLAINTMSFAEMPEAVVDAYGDLIAATLAPGGVLFEQNFDMGALDTQHFCTPETVLARHFATCRSVGSGCFMGVPRLWSRA
jgi:hypothetical protein